MIGWWKRQRSEGIFAPGSPSLRRDALNAALIISGCAAFLLLATLLLAFDQLMPDTSGASLRVGSIAPQDFRAPFSLTYDSAVLTERQRQAAANAVSTIYDLPDPDVARQQLLLIRQILDFIDNVRHDSFGTTRQKNDDLNAITALTLDDGIIRSILEMDDQTWQAVDGEAALVLERVMRESIRETDLPNLIDQLPTQVSVRFTPASSAVVVALVADLLRPNRMPNPDATAAARAAAADAVAPERRSFERGQIVIRAGARIDAVDFEALENLGLLDAPDRRLEVIGQAFLSSLMVLIAAALYIERRQPSLFAHPRFLTLLAAIFLLTIAGARLFGGGGQLYLYPAAALGVLIVALTAPEIAIFGVISAGLLIGIMLDNSIEAGTLVAFGGSLGALALRRSERLNSFFFAGVVIALANALVVLAFNAGLLSVDNGVRLGELILFAVINGFFSALTALAGVYAFTLLFNLPTSLKLVELSQPSQPLLQRLLREAPGTYQHSLQVANMGEQAANAIGANAELTRVAAMYHDVGKMLNPAFFVENQVDGINPHDDLNDPYRSADIIIGHVIDGEKLAAQYRIPTRIRDFIREHHGTTRVMFFYTRAQQQAEDPDSVDVDHFTYPGPKPQSRETAVLMLADNCESTVRARKPANKQEIVDVINQVIDTRMRDGQLDESGLRLNDIKVIRSVFVDILQGVFHPRINYPTPHAATIPLVKAAPSPVTQEEPLPLDLVPTRYLEAEISAPKLRTTELPAFRVNDAARDTARDAGFPPVPAADSGKAPSAAAPVDDQDVSARDDDDRPLRDVPPLRRTQRTNRVDGDRPKEDV
jgi:hypothetical protein